MVAKQCQAAQQRAGGCVLWRTGVAKTALTLNAKTARCGSAGRAVWQGWSR